MLCIGIACPFLDMLFFIDKICPTAQIYSTLPSGMETVVRLKLDGMNITEVAFGSVDFKVNEEVHIKVKSDKNLLFADDKEGKVLAQGSIY